jgi:hypothetical protein
VTLARFQVSIDTPDDFTLLPVEVRRTFAPVAVRRAAIVAQNRVTLLSGVLRVALAAGRGNAVDGVDRSMAVKTVEILA